MDGTLEARYDTNVRELLATDPDAAISYMLRAMPLISEYCTTDDSGAREAKPSHLDAFGISATETSSKKDVLGRYMAEVEGDHTGLVSRMPLKKWHDSDFTCSECGTATLFDQAQALHVCPSCGVSTPYFEMSHRNMSFDEQMSMQVSSHCAYKRCNHFGKSACACR